MVLRGDGNSPAPKVLDRLIATAVAELELEGVSPEGMGQQLVSKANSKNRLFADELPEFLMDVSQRGWIPRTVREEDAIRVFREYLGGGGGGAHDFHLEASLREAAMEVAGAAR